jgi:cell division protein FtsW (lipid II flippase)
MGLIQALAGIAAVVGLILLILALVGVLPGLLVLGIVLLVVGGVVFLALYYFAGRTTRRRSVL